jgi:DNA-binding response OmpR family regulator
VKSVLVIDDNREIRENTAELLSLNGFEVFTAVNGKNGFDEVKSKHPDIILCDIMMPETNGKEFLRLVKNDATTCSIPLIFFSAGSVPLKVKKGLIQGADAYLPKPFTEQELLEVIERNINIHKS